MIAPDRWNSKDAILAAFSASAEEFELVMAMASVGWAFCQIHAFERLVVDLLLTASSVKIGKKAKDPSLDAAAKMLATHAILRKETLGQLVGHLQNAGLNKREANYLRNLVELRNEFVHHFSRNVPMPGDWAKFGYDAEHFSIFSHRVGRKFEYAGHYFVRILIRAKILKGELFGSSYFLSDFNDDFLSPVE